MRRELPRLHHAVLLLLLCQHITFESAMETLSHLSTHFGCLALLVGQHTLVVSRFWLVQHSIPGPGGSVLRVRTQNKKAQKK